jgi:hypothetical protein
MYYVIIIQEDQMAKLECHSYDEAVKVKQSFINYGKCQSVTIEKKA